MKLKYILALGSNIGDREENIYKAINQISSFLKIDNISSIYHTSALLPKNHPNSWEKDYINIALSGFSSLNAQAILKKVKQIEKNIGRINGERWSPRLIDIDIIIAGNLIVKEENLTIPHKDSLVRDFVIFPISEIEPNFIHPTENKSFSTLASSFNKANKYIFKVVNNDKIIRNIKL
jgi:2-amino-4-hydroxy-6-hydroxymethyldihydropteridine diphosphokinase